MFHKFLENKESELPFAYLLAEEGFFVIGIDMRGHGNRKRSYDKTQEYDLNMLLEDIIGTAKDAAKIRKNKELFRNFDISGAAVAVGGVSAGASAALYCMMEMEDMKGVLCLIGTYDMRYIIKHKKLDDFQFFFRKKISVDYERMQIRCDESSIFRLLTEEKMKPICFLNGGLDHTVPYACREVFHKRLARIYENCGKKDMVLAKDYAKAGHELTYPMKRDAIHWLKKL